MSFLGLQVLCDLALFLSDLLSCPSPLPRCPLATESTSLIFQQIKHVPSAWDALELAFLHWLPLVSP